jgi:ubiquinone/menaquinone biosynthesis C-methylase UbiE
MEDATKQKARATYNAAADHFDDAALEFWTRAGERTVARLALPPGSRVLDVCAGTGASAIPAARAVGQAGSVIAIDLAESLLALGRAKATAERLSNLEFRVGDMTQLELDDASFDAVIIVFGIFFVADMEAQVRALLRLVRPGGVLAVTTWGPRFFEPLYAVWRESLGTHRPDLMSDFNPWDRITTTDAVRALLQVDGAIDVEVTLEESLQPLERAEDWWTIVLGSGLRWSVDQMAEETARVVRDENIARARHVAAIETNVIYGVTRRAR